MAGVQYFLFRCLAIVGAGLAGMSLAKRCFAYSTYTVFMLVQCFAYSHTGWLVCIVSVLVTLVALLMTKEDRT